MIEIERSAAEGVQIGPYVVRVLAVHAGEVVFALDTDSGCALCGRSVVLRRCPACLAEAVVCPSCAGAWGCPACLADRRP